MKTPHRQHLLAVLGCLLISALSACGGGESSSVTAAILATPANTANAAPVTVNFDASGSQGEIVNYAWDFAGAGSATGKTATHTFPAQGQDKVTLYVTGSDGDIATDTINFIIDAGNLGPRADFSVNPATVRANRAITFDGSASADADGSIIKWQWDFGDGNTASGAVVDYSFETSGQHTIQLSVTDNLGAQHQSAQTLAVQSANQLPLAAFTQPPGALINSSVSFDASASNDPDGEIDTYAWDFADGLTASGKTARHTFTTAGTHTVTLSVTDSAGESSSRSQEIEVRTINSPPVAAFSATPKANRIVDLDASGSSDDSGIISSYSWSLNGVTQTGKSITHTFPVAGVHSVILTVTDSEGLSHSTTQNVKAADGVTRILAIGDSITQGDNNHPSYRYPLWKRLVEVKKTFDMLGPRQGANTGALCSPSRCPSVNGQAFDQDHAAYWGWTTEAVASQAASWDLGDPNLDPDLALIHLGTNDLLQSQNNASTEAELGHLIRDLYARFPSVKIYLATLIPVDPDPSNGFIREQRQRAATSMPDLNRRIRNLRGEFPELVIVEQNNAVTLADLYDDVHPGSRGESQMANAWFEAIKDQVF